MLKNPSNSTGWRSKFSKKNIAVDTFNEKDHSLLESFHFVSRSITPLSKHNVPFDPYLGLSEQSDRAVCNPPQVIDSRSERLYGLGKLDRIRGDGMDAQKLTPYHDSINRSASGSNLQAMSRSTSSQHVNTEETSCPVCLELLSFRLAGEKRHITPTCGHALHHACFTAVYGSPEAILATQSIKGRGTSAPGMCGVCRNLITLGEEGEGRRNDSE